MPVPCHCFLFTFLVLEKMFEGFEHIWAWRPSWLHDLEHLYKHSFPLSNRGSRWNLSMICPAVLEKIFENGGRRTTLGYFFPSKKFIWVVTYNFLCNFFILRQ